MWDETECTDKINFTSFFYIFMWLLENFKGLMWLTFYFHWTAVLSDLKKVPNLTIIYSFLGGDVEVEAGIQARDGRWGLVEGGQEAGPTRGRG